jgi:hypothetical protein
MARINIDIPGTNRRLTSHTPMSGPKNDQTKQRASSPTLRERWGNGGWLPFSPLTVKKRKPPRGANLPGEATAERVPPSNNTAGASTSATPHAFGAPMRIEGTPQEHKIPVGTTPLLDSPSPYTLALRPA